MVAERSPRQTWLWPYLLRERAETTAWNRPFLRVLIDQLPFRLVVSRPTALRVPFLFFFTRVTLRFFLHLPLDEATLPKKRLPCLLMVMFDSALNSCDWAVPMPMGATGDSAARAERVPGLSLSTVGLVSDAQWNMIGQW